jgi:hypothetical protein
MRDQEIREALDQHWTASNSGGIASERAIHHEDAGLDYPQSRERLISRQNIQIARSLQPNKRRFVVHQILGSGDLRITELVRTYDGKPFYTVSIMGFRGVKVARETQYFADAFPPGESHKRWTVSMNSPKEGQGSAESRDDTGAH